MNGNSWKCIINQKYLIKYWRYKVEIYEINSKNQVILILILKMNAVINYIQFNTLVDNIIIISFSDGTCRIYNILNKSDIQDILFESIDGLSIEVSLFNKIDPNIIATLNAINDIIIWDVRKPHYKKKIRNIDDIYVMKWSHYNSDYLEILNNAKMARLVNIDTQKIEKEIEIKKMPINFLFLKENIFLLILKKEIQIKNFINNSLINKLEFEKIILTDENLIEDYNILIIITEKKIYFMNISTFSIVKKDNFNIINGYTFFYRKKDNEIGLNYINNDDDESDLVEQFNFQLNLNITKSKENKNLINIKNNFYEKYYKRIFKYVCLLHFNENIQPKQNFKKNYMKIEVINDFFNKIRKTNIFNRKNFVTQLLDSQKYNNNVENNNLNDELKIMNFPKLTKYIETLTIEKNDKNNNNEINRKNIIMKTLKNYSQNKKDFINEFYVEIIKLLTIDNTNQKLLEIYLLFLNLYEINLITEYGEENIEKYNNEVNYYSACFSKEDYKILFEKDKNSEEEILFNFLEKAMKLQNFDYNNLSFKNLINEINDKFPDFNQPIEYDCNNNELKWFIIKKHIFITFKNLKLTIKYRDLLEKLRLGVKTVYEKKLLKNQDIIANKYKLQSALFLIINPCPLKRNNNSLEFFCNSLLSKKNNLNELSRNYTIINNKLEYKGEIYDNIEDICLQNLSYKEFIPEEKYNFNYLIDNYVKNKNDIKKFLKNILTKKVFIEVNEILFGDKNYKLLDKRYLEEFIDKRLEFVPIRPSETLAISDKISLNTFISTKRRQITLKTDKISLDHLTDILNTSNYILDEEHEIFHLLDCLPYYENNCSISIDTPRKREYDGKVEGGNYLELLLFNKIINSINLGEALFLLNEENYDKSLTDFKNDFENKNYKDLIIKGVFSRFNDYLDIQSIPLDELNNSYINQKLNNSNSIFDSFIVNYLENDVAGKKYY